MQKNATTTSMPAAAFAVAHGCARPQLEQLGHNWFKFVFEDKDGTVSRLILGYFNAEPAPACAFYKALQTLRANVNAIKNGGAR